MPLEGNDIIKAVKDEITDYDNSQLKIISAETENYAIKFVNSQWAASYHGRWRPLHISATPALTWGTATYVTPLRFPLSSALYGRIGLITSYNPAKWRIFDATRPAAATAYTNWVRAQPIFRELVLTVHSTHANHVLRNQFREDFQIDCVLFHPDQEAELHTDLGNHVWMAVTDWARKPRGRSSQSQSPSQQARTINLGKSARLRKARFTVLIDEDFALLENGGLPIHKAPRRIEKITEQIKIYDLEQVPLARSNRGLPARMISMYQQKGYLHVYIVP